MGFDASGASLPYATTCLTVEETTEKAEKQFLGELKLKHAIYV